MTRWAGVTCNQTLTSGRRVSWACCLVGIWSLVSGQRANSHKDSANITCSIPDKWIVYPSGKATYRTWRNLLNSKTDDSHSFLIPSVLTRGRDLSIMVHGGGRGYSGAKVRLGQVSQSSCTAGNRISGCQQKQHSLQKQCVGNIYGVMNSCKEYNEMQKLGESWRKKSSSQKLMG